MTLTFIDVTGENRVVIGKMELVDGVVQADDTVADLLRRPAGVPRTVTSDAGLEYLLALADEYALNSRVIVELRNDEGEVI